MTFLGPPPSPSIFGVFLRGGGAHFGVKNGLFGTPPSIFGVLLKGGEKRTFWGQKWPFWDPHIHFWGLFKGGQEHFGVKNGLSGTPPSIFGVLLQGGGTFWGEKWPFLDPPPPPIHFWGLLGEGGIIPISVGTQSDFGVFGGHSKGATKILGGKRAILGS